jgi:hypothetical protein
MGAFSSKRTLFVSSLPPALYFFLSTLGGLSQQRVSDEMETK